MLDSKKGDEPDDESETLRYWDLAGVGGIWTGKTCRAGQTDGSSRGNACSQQQEWIQRGRTGIREGSRFITWAGRAACGCDEVPSGGLLLDLRDRPGVRALPTLSGPPQRLISRATMVHGLCVYSLVCRRGD